MDRKWQSFCPFPCELAGHEIEAMAMDNSFEKCAYDTRKDISGGWKGV